MEIARRLYYLTAVTWQRTHRRFRRLPLMVQAMIRHPFLTLTPLLIAALLVGATLSPNPEPPMSELNIQIRPHVTEVAP